VTFQKVLASHCQRTLERMSVQPVVLLAQDTTEIDLARPQQIVEFHCVRWNIEILFRTLKSGCRVEQRRFEHVDRILPCLAMYLIAAWRTLFVHLIGQPGGYIQRPNSAPGPQTIWIGLQQMRDLAWAWDTFGPQAKVKSG
jgi:hypothetical protein